MTSRGRAPQEHLLEIAYDSSDTVMGELVQSALFMTGSRGSSTRDGTGRSVVTAWFDSSAARDAARAAFEGLDVELTAVDRESVNWLERYQQSLHPIEIGERFIVAPDATLIPRGSHRLSIVVPQEQAFGTGSHESTALCLELMESIDLTDKRGLDVGAGSGILALGMLRLGAKRALAFDNDPDAYGALRDNRIRNAVTDSAMPLFIGSAESLRGGLFDVVTMNILPEVIVALLPSVSPRLAAGARLIVSGVVAERRDEVVEAAASFSLPLRDERTRGEWWAGSFQSGQRAR